MIVKFSRWSDKIDLLRSRDARDAMRWDGYRLASDLTRKQTAEIQRLKNEGKSGYYRNGKLVVTDRNRHGGRFDASDTGGGDDYRQYGRHHRQGRHFQRQSRRGDERHHYREYTPDYDQQQYAYSNHHQQLYNYNYDDWPRLDVNSDPTLRWFGDPAVREAEWRNTRSGDWDDGSTEIYWQWYWQCTQPVTN
nr:hypothetical protein BaRGS_025710 [Batillaria attramentaria]